MARIFRPITRPLRGVGRVLRGNVREGLGDIGYGAKRAGPVLAATGVVPTPHAFAIGTAGGALERAGRPGATPRTVLGGAAEGAAWTGVGYGAGKAWPGIGKALGGGEAAVAPDAVMGHAGGFPLISSTATPAATSTGAKYAGIGSRLAGAGRGIAGWARDNPADAVQLAGVGFQGYGAHQEGRAADRQIAFQQQQAERQWQFYEEGERRRRARQEAFDPVKAQMIGQLLARR